MTVLPWLSHLHCPVLAVLSSLTCSGHPVSVSFPGCTILTVFSGCPVLAVLSHLSCPRYPALTLFPAHLSPQSRQCCHVQEYCLLCPVMADPSRLICQADVMFQMSCTDFAITAVLPRLSCPRWMSCPSIPVVSSFVLAVLSLITCSRCPALAVLSYIPCPRCSVLEILY
jgi:hypothetical protein